MSLKKKTDLEKQTNDSHITCYQNAIHYKQKENAFIRNCNHCLFSLVFIVGRMTEIFSVRLKKTDKSLKA